MDDLLEEEGDKYGSEEGDKYGSVDELLEEYLKDSNFAIVYLNMVLGDKDDEDKYDLKRLLSSTMFKRLYPHLWEYLSSDPRIQ